MTGAQHVGMRVRTYRKQRQLTLAELSKKINKSISTIAKYESGDISVDVETLFIIASVLEVSVNQLTDFQPVKHALCKARNGNFFERHELFYMYQYFGPDKKVYVYAIEVIRNPERPDNVVIYYDIHDIKDYKNCSCIYYGTINCYDTVSTIMASNPYSHSDVIFLYVKAPFTQKSATTGILTGLSQSMRNPYAYKVIISSSYMEITDQLREDLLVTGKDAIAELRRSNGLIVH